MTTLEIKHPLPATDIEFPSAAESSPGSAANTAVNVQGVPGGTPVAVDVDGLDILATEATLLDVKTAIENINVTADVDTGDLATSAKQDLQQTALDAIKTELQSGTLDVHVTDASVAITAASLPLPSGASTEATASAIKNAVEGTLDVNIVGGAAPGTEYDDGETIAMPTGTVVLGHDGSNVQALSTNPAGELKIQIQNFPITQPVSAVSLPLPPGAATETTLSTRASETTAAGIKTAVESIDTKLDGPLNTRVLASGTDSVTTVPSGTQAVGSTQLPATLDAGNLRVAVEASVLPTGAATETTLNAIKTELQTGTLDVNIVSGGASAGTEYADGAAAATPTGTVALGHDGTNVQALSTNGSGELKVQIQNLPATQNVADGGASLTVDSTQLPAALVGGRLSVDGSGVTQPVSAASLPLPAGAATETTLSAINTKAPVLGQTTKSGSVPVTLASDQGNVGVTFSNPTSVATAGGTQPTTSTMVGGSDGSNIQHVRVFDADSGVGSQYVLGAVLRKSASGGSVEAGTASDPLRVDPTGTTTQPVSGTVTANIGTSGSLALDATLTGGTQKSIIRGGAKGSTTAADVTSTASGANNQSLDVIRRDASGNVAPTGDTETRAVYVKTGTNTLLSHVGHDGSGSYLPLRAFDADSGAGQQYVLGTVLRKSASGGSVEAGTSSDPLRVDPTGTTTQPVSDAGGSLTVDSTQLPASLGQKTMANSFAVVISSDQSAVPVSSSTLAADATLTGGTQKAITRGGAKGSTTAADVTSTASGADHQALDVVVYDNAGNPITSFGGGTEYTDGEFTGGAAQGTMVLGQEDATNCHAMAVDSLGRVKVVDGGASLTVDDGGGALTVDSAQLPAALVGARLDINNGAWLGSTAPTVGQKTMANSLPVAIASDQALPYNADKTSSGTLTAASQTVSISTAGCGAVAFYTSGTWSLTAQIEATIDGSNWVSVAAQAYGAGVSSIAPVATSSIGSATNVSGVFSCAGYQNFRIRCSAYTSGTMTVALTASAAPAAVRVMQGAPSNIQNAWYQIVTDGTNSMPTMDTMARAGFHKITDGTSTAAVKPASTAAATTDPALVVAKSLNDNPGTATLSNVSGSASSVTLLSANASRKGAIITNDSTAVCYVKFGTTASTTSFTVYILGSVSGAPSYYEVPFTYTGRIDAIWASATGTARITELT